MYMAKGASIHARHARINQAAVQTFGWLDPGQMVTGLGLAESTPGPLIMVTQFVGFLGAYRFPGGLEPVIAGVLGATVTVWHTMLLVDIPRCSLHRASSR
jgi:chromate transporter